MNVKASGLFLGLSTLTLIAGATFSSEALADTNTQVTGPNGTTVKTTRDTKDREVNRTVKGPDGSTVKVERDAGHGEVTTTRTGPDGRTVETTRDAK
jgi:hypothetical protein